LRSLVTRGTANMLNVGGFLWQCVLKSVLGLKSKEVPEKGQHCITKNFITCKKKSRNRPCMVQKVPGGLGSQIFMTFGT
jgi:hypothetical protein